MFKTDNKYYKYIVVFILLLIFAFGYSQQVYISNYKSQLQQFQLENLAFKVLRRSVYLKKLNDLKLMSYDNLQSIKEKSEPEV